MTDTRSRQPQGIPTGGQFATEAKAEPTVTWDGGPFDRTRMTDDEVYTAMVDAMSEWGVSGAGVDRSADMALPLEQRAFYRQFRTAQEAQTRLILIETGSEGVRQELLDPDEFEPVTRVWSDQRLYATGRPSEPYVEVVQSFVGEAYQVDEESTIPLTVDEHEELYNSDHETEIRYGVTCRTELSGFLPSGETIRYEVEYEGIGPMWLNSVEEAEQVAHSSASNINWGRDIFPENWT